MNQGELSVTNERHPQPPLPRWRGFNLIEMAETRMAYPDRTDADFAMDIPEDDFRWIADWGFNFVRVCLNYRLWTCGEDLNTVDEAKLAKIDRVVELGRKHGIHVSLDMHRGPGKWEIPPRLPPLNLWKDAVAVDAFAFHWETLALRYKGVSPNELSFDLLNEPERVGGPEGLTLAWFEQWVRRMVAAIRKQDPQRLIFAEGPRWARDYAPALEDLGLAWSFHCWDPISLSHWGTGWEAKENWPRPTWPMARPADGGWPRNDDYHESFDRAGLERHIRPWLDLADRGVPVHCGETGLYHQAPHDAALAWLGDFLGFLKRHHIGFAYWALRGTFGVLDSGRGDARLGNWHGHSLDGALLKLLQAS
jgi:endoglucanase